MDRQKGKERQMEDKMRNQRGRVKGNTGGLERLQWMELRSKSEEKKIQWEESAKPKIKEKQ